MRSSAYGRNDALSASAIVTLLAQRIRGTGRLTRPVSPEVERVQARYRAWTGFDQPEVHRTAPTRLETNAVNQRVIAAAPPLEVPRCVPPTPRLPGIRRYRVLPAAVDVARTDLAVRSHAQVKRSVRQGYRLDERSLMRHETIEEQGCDYQAHERDNQTTHRQLRESNVWSRIAP